MRPTRTVFAALALLGLWLLTACAGSTPAAPDNLAGSRSGASESLSLAYDPSDGSLLKADRDGLLRWHSNGGWERVNVTQNQSLSGVIVNPDSPNVIFVSGPGLGVLRSDDDGANWKDINTGLPSLDVTALALHSFRRETLYAWLKGGGSYRTEDGGAQWVKMPDQGPPDTDVRGLTHSTLPGSMNTGWLYAATPTGAYLSMDCF